MLGFRYRNERLKFLGITLCKWRISHGNAYFYLLGIRVYRSKTFSKITKLCAETKRESSDDFDMRELDCAITQAAATITCPSIEPKKNRIAYLATIVFDMGGHTKCIQSLAESFVGVKEQRLFLVQKTLSESRAPVILKALAPICPIDGVDTTPFRFHSAVQHLAASIASYAPEAVIAYIHPEDLYGAAVLSVLRRCTQIKLLFFNHASHFPTVGMGHVHRILECMPSTQAVTHTKRHYTHTALIGLQSVSKTATHLLTPLERTTLREVIGIPADKMVTMTGCSAYKLFDNTHSSQYLEMIVRLLKREPNLVHVIMSEFDATQMEVVKEAFGSDIEVRSRLLFVPFKPDFERYFQCADIFIDSFPIASALTHIDLMRCKVASVIKINRAQPEFSFHEYQSPDYPYMFEDVNAMEDAICELLHDVKKREAIIARQYAFWEATYESSVVRDRYLKRIEEIA